MTLHRPHSFPRALLVLLSCVAGATVSGCATTYRPTERRPVERGGLRAELLAVEGPSFASLSTPDDFPARRSFLLGPFLTLRLTAPDRRRAPGFAPATTHLVHSLELGIRHLRATGWGPADRAWFFAVGWSFEGTL